MFNNKLARNIIELEYLFNKNSVFTQHFLKFSSLMKIKRGIFMPLDDKLLPADWQHFSVY